MHDLRKTLGVQLWVPLAAALLLPFLGAPAAFADGTEQLGPPLGVSIASGSGIVAAGVGLSHAGSGQPGTISIDVPGTVKQALLYWEGANQSAADYAATMDITVDPGSGAVAVTGDAIGGNTQYSTSFVTVSYRADITPLVVPGSNVLVIDGLDFNTVNDGAGILVIYDDGSRSAIEIRDGSDYAFRSDLGGTPLRVTEPQEFLFAASAQNRMASLSLFFGAVAGSVSGGTVRPNTIEITVAGATTELINVLNSVDGEEWDTVYQDASIDVPIPAGATSLTVQAFSDDRLGTGLLPASMVWVTAGLSVEVKIPPEGCRLTGGLNDSFETAEGENQYTAGGQVGANTALPPQPKGEWTHTQKRGPAGAFTFHGGTASAPEATEIDEIRCSDPGTCKPSGDPPSPSRQLDFDGIGTFKSIGSSGSRIPDFVLAGANVTAEGRGNRDFDGTFHWFEVNVDDNCEPGNTNPNKNPDDPDPELCPPNGFGEKGDQALANCGCSDFYRITIYDGVNAADVVKNPDGSVDPSMLNRTDVIYEVQGYIDGGNQQLHLLTGFDR
jgi:hypothetical protein